MQRLDEGVAAAGDDRTFEFDLFLVVPVHRAPGVIEESGMAEDGWIPVDAGTLETRFAGVYAIGDVTSVPVPRAGVFAEGEAVVVAERIAATVRGEDASSRYGGTASCFLEWGDDRVARVDVDFFGAPGPTARFQNPSREIHAEKLAPRGGGRRCTSAAFGADGLRRWFW